jgi:hypothetical protein
MISLPASKFEKQRQCPSSELLLSYQQQVLNPDQASPITAHLCACDFCTAELQLLARYPCPVEAHELPPLPVELRALAEALLSRNRLRSTSLLDRIFEQRASTGPQAL